MFHPYGYFYMDLSGNQTKGGEPFLTFKQADGQIKQKREEPCKEKK